MPDQFTKAIRQIMADEGEAAGLAIDPGPPCPASFGWLRKPEWDRAGGEAWELPDGAIRLVRPLDVARRTSRV